MMDKEIIQFAQELITQVRDNAIQALTAQLHSTNLRSPTTRRWDEAKKSGNFDKFGEVIIADSVDQALFQFFNAIDEGLLKISYSTKDHLVNLAESEITGELAGWYIGEWRSEFSKERVYNNNA